MRTCFRLVAAFVAAQALGACTLANLTSIHREFDLTLGRSQIIDAKQRAVYVSAPDKNGHVRVCSEPSPDALTLLAASGDLSASNANRTSVGASASVAESGGSIGLRTAGIQQLRDMTFRLCEAFLSGAIDRNSYDLQLRRYQNQLVVLLAIEQLTGAVTGPSLAVLNSASGGPAGTASEYLSQRNALKKEKDQLDAVISSNDTTADQKKNATDRLKLVNYNLAFYEGALENLKATGAIAGGVAAGVTTVQQRGIAGDIKEVSKAVEAMVTKLLDRDYSTQLCFQYSLEPIDKDRNFLQNQLDEGLQAYCKLVLTSHAISRSVSSLDLNEASKLLSACAAEISDPSNNSTVSCDKFRKLANLRPVAQSGSENGPLDLPSGSNSPFMFSPKFTF